MVIGNYTVVQDKSNTLAESDQNFLIKYKFFNIKEFNKLEGPVDINGMSLAKVLVNLANTSLIRFEKLTFITLSFDNMSYYGFQILPDNLNVSRQLHVFSKALCLLNATDLSEPKRIHDSINKQLTSFGYEIVSLSFQTIYDMNILDPFMLHHGINGTIYLPNFDVMVEGAEFDLIHYIKEGKLHGVFTAIFFVINFYGWISLSNNFNSRAKREQLSIYSLIMNIGYEFSYALLLFSFSLSLEEFQALFTILFIYSVISYFTIHMKLLTEVWRSTTEFDDMDMNELRSSFISFFGKVSFFMFASSLSTSVMFDYPIIAILYLFSSFIPQVVYSAKSASKKNGDLFYIISSAMNRTYLAIYYYMYPYNIAMNSLYRNAAIIGILFLWIQVIIIILQNRFGGGFFLPESVRPRPYDYHSSLPPPGTECAICMANIEEGDDSMVTPCNHYFHSECLERWMQEQYICPLCRHSLPS